MCPRYRAEKIRIDPAQPSTIDIKLPYRKYFKVKGVELELDNIKQDLSGRYVLCIDGSDGLSEVIKDKTWVVQEIVSNDFFELSRVEIKMEAPLEDDQELLVCDDNLYEKTRGVIKYDESKGECFVLLNPTVQIQDGERIFIAVKLGGTPVNMKTGVNERLFASYTDYPDGFKERDPFPGFLRRGLASGKDSLVYKLYSERPLDIQPSFQIKIGDSLPSIWTWKGEEKIVLKGEDIAESINIYFLENRGASDDEKDLVLPLIFTSENSTYPIDLELTSSEFEIKTPKDYFTELKSAVETVFKNNVATKDNLVTQLQAIWNSFDDESMDDLKEAITSFIQSIYFEKQQAQTKGSANEIKGILELAEELEGMF